MDRPLSYAKKVLGVKPCRFALDPIGKKKGVSAGQATTQNRSDLAGFWILGPGDPLIPAGIRDQLKEEWCCYAIIGSQFLI